MKLRLSLFIVIACLQTEGEAQSVATETQSLYAAVNTSHVLTARGSGFAQLSLPGGGGGCQSFELGKFFTVLKALMQELLDFFQRNQRQFANLLFF